MISSYLSREYLLCKFKFVIALYIFVNEHKSFTGINLGFNFIRKFKSAELLSNEDQFLVLSLIYIYMLHLKHNINVCINYF